MLRLGFSQQDSTLLLAHSQYFSAKWYVMRIYRATGLIRFLWSSERIVGVAVVDDGVGMDTEQLRNAMRFGSATHVDHTSLGKFGLGLKLSSLSHARKLTVVSRRDGLTVGRRWTLAGIRRCWDCDTFEECQAAALIDAPWSPIDLRTSGTLVLWDDIEALIIVPSKTECSGRG